MVAKMRPKLSPGCRILWGGCSVGGVISYVGVLSCVVYGICTCVQVLVYFFRFLHYIILSRVRLFLFSKLENYTHTGDQNVTSPTRTHSTTQGNQLCV